MGFQKWSQAMLPKIVEYGYVQKGGLLPLLGKHTKNLNPNHKSELTSQ